MIRKWISLEKNQSEIIREKERLIVFFTLKLPKTNQMNPKLLTQSLNYLQNSFSIFLCIIKLTWWVQRVLNVLEGFAHRSLWRGRTKWNMVSVYLNDTNTWRHINMFVTPKQRVLEWDIDGLHFERSCFASSNELF